MNFAMKRALWVMFLFSQFSFSQLGLTQIGTSQVASAKTESSVHKISVMTFNVENLFDTKHDVRPDGVHKLDYTFLPVTEKKTESHETFCKAQRKREWQTECLKLNWSEKALNDKIEKLKNVILSVNNGKGPDVLILQEIENLSVLERLAKELNQGYTAVLIDGSDARGIDVGVLSKFEILNSEHHALQFEDPEFIAKKDFREILEVNVKLPNAKPLTILGAHLSAPYHNKKFRRAGFLKLQEILKQKGDEAYVISGGDYNTTAEEDRSFGILKELVEPWWQVAHKTNCKDECKGTTYYHPKKQWSFLDMILTSKNIKILKTEIIQNRFQVDKKGRPRSFDPQKQEGVSDHLPLYTEIEL